MGKPAEDPDPSALLDTCRRGVPSQHLGLSGTQSHIRKLTVNRDTIPHTCPTVKGRQSSPPSGAALGLSVGTGQCCRQSSHWPHIHGGDETHAEPLRAFHGHWPDPTTRWPRTRPTVLVLEQNHSGPAGTTASRPPPLQREHLPRPVSMQPAGETLPCSTGRSAAARTEPRR